MEPLVSIATPVWNTARFLPAALDSLLAQDHPHWECLLWDDGSTDGSAEIAAEYSRRDPRFRLLGNGRNNGVGIALSSALDAARGDYVGVLDGDDLLEPDALSSMLAFMQARPQLGMAYSQYVEIDEDGGELGLGGRFRTPYSPQRLLLEFMTYHFRLARSDAYRAVGGFDPSMDVSADYDFCLRMSERHPVEHLPKDGLRVIQPPAHVDVLGATAGKYEGDQGPPAGRRAAGRRVVDERRHDRPLLARAHHHVLARRHHQQRQRE